MTKLIALIVVGSLLMIGGIVYAVLSLGCLYQATLADPLGVPDGLEANAQRGMLRGAGIAAAGAMPLLLGGWLLRRSSARAKAARRRSA